MGLAHKCVLSNPKLTALGGMPPSSYRPSRRERKARNEVRFDTHLDVSYTHDRDSSSCFEEDTVHVL